MSSNLQGAIREYFNAAVHSIPEKSRKSAILFGGAASFLNGVTERHPLDLDFAGGQDAFLQVGVNKQHGFKIEDDV